MKTGPTLKCEPGLHYSVDLRIQNICVYADIFLQYTVFVSPRLTCSSKHIHFHGKVIQIQKRNLVENSVHFTLYMPVTPNCKYI